MQKHQNIVVSESLRAATEHTLKELEKIFKRPEYTPTDTHNEILYIEGQQNVLNYIRRQMLGMPCRT